MSTRSLQIPSPHDRPSLAGLTPRRPPLRALVSLLGCLSLVAALVVVTGPAAGAAQANPNLATACGLDFALVIDRSASVAGDGASDTVRNAAKAFLTALKDTGSKVSLTSFGTSATVDKSATALTTANLAGLKAKVDGASTSSTPTTPTGKTASSRRRARSAGSRAASPTSS